MVQMAKPSRKQRTEAAIGYALNRRWDLAAQQNQSLLTEFPDDLEAANRLGKALTELGDLNAAALAYRRTLEIDPTNNIARRNLTRIEELQAQSPKTTKRAPAASTAKRPRTTRTPATATPAGPVAVRPHSLIEESGRSAEFTLLEPNIAALKRVSAGDPAELVATPRGIAVKSATGAVLGHIEPRAGLRLRRLMEGGNTYAGVLRRITDIEATIYVRETYRTPEQQNEPSFLPQAAIARRRAAPRASIRSTIVRYDTPDDDEESSDDSWTPRGGTLSSTDDDEMGEAGFGDANADSDGDDDDDLDSLAGDDDDEPMAADDEEES